MATIKIELRPSKVEDRAGTVVYRITHLRKIRRIKTSIRLHPEEWNEETECVVCQNARTSATRAKIDREFRKLKHIVRQLEDSRKTYSADDIADRYRSSARDISVVDFMQERIMQLRDARRLGTARNYERTMNSFAKYLEETQLPLAALTERVIDGYNGFLIRQGLVRNSISFYMRVLRAVYNRAVKQRLVEQCYPFQNVYTGIDRTHKKAVDEKIVLQLFRLDLRHSPALALTRDLFVFSYCTRGMAFVDMAYLRKTDLRNGNIYYARRKTQRQLCVRIEPNIRRIIDKYAGNPSPYVFPILKTEDAAKAYSQYQTALNYHNRQLKRLAGMLHLESGLSSYTARHSWAVAARNRNIPISVISAGMGHSSERTTQIYLTMLDNSVIDSANRLITASIR